MIRKSMLLAGLGGVLAYLSLSRGKRWGFRERVVVITGGSRGLGLILARQFAAEGARLAICARDAHELKTAEDELRNGGARVFSSTCDVSSREQVEEFLARARHELGPVDVLVNNAGIMIVGPVENLSQTEIDAAMGVNFWGMVHATYAVLPTMIERRGGRIVNITSIGGVVSVPHLIPYSSAKFAAVGFSQGIQAEMARHDIRVTTVIPGLVRTGSFVNALFKGKREEEFRWFKLGAVMPLLSMDAERAARRIVEACRRGEPVTILGFPAKVIRWLNLAFPNLVSRAMAWVSRALPAPGPREEIQREPAPRIRRGPRAAY